MADGTEKRFDSGGFDTIGRTQGGIGAGFEGVKTGDHIGARGIAIRTGKTLTELGPLRKIRVSGKHWVI